jgi:peptidoglycan/xylan/chitin deacetylase (PgdA/CDA1 family)
MQGIFTISLDFELHWGVFDKRTRESRELCYKNTLQLIPELLKLFEEYEVHATWATVGGVFAKDRHEWEHLKPSVLPDYKVEKYSAYRWVEQHGLPEDAYFAHFAPEAVNSILQYPGQELGTHTFGHFYCLEEQNSLDAFDADLKAAKKIASSFTNSLVSLVFPRNQFNEQSLKICFDNGIRVVRSNPANWFWAPVADSKPQLMRKIFRTGDAYVQLGSRTSYPLNSVRVKPNEPMQLPASRLLRPWNPSYKIANELSSKRILGELKTAAIQHECYHLWWHPENFGDYPEQNISTLKAILQEFARWKKRYGMTSWNMGEYATHLLKT